MLSKENWNKLTESEKAVILHKGTEPPFSGESFDLTSKGVFVCRQCENQLFLPEDKFDSRCGWPSFDDTIEGAVERIADRDGHRVEILCANCKGHLGHVFEGERFTRKNTRHCVNSLSIKYKQI